MATSKSKSPFTGSWHIVSMFAWEDEALNEEVQAFIEFDEEGMGRFQFGYVRGFVDHYRTKKRDRMRVAQFNWHGEDGAEGTPLDGIGWVILEGGELTGTICIHLFGKRDRIIRASSRRSAPCSPATV